VFLARLFDLPIADWEEKAACACFLDQRRGGSLQGLPPDTAGRVREALRRLNGLPVSWARELCLAVLDDGGRDLDPCPAGERQDA